MTNSNTGHARLELCDCCAQCRSFDFLGLVVNTILRHAVLFAFLSPATYTQHAPWDGVSSLFLKVAPGIPTCHTGVVGGNHMSVTRLALTARAIWLIEPTPPNNFASAAYAALKVL